MKKLVTVAFVFAASHMPAGEWKQLASLPNKVGFAGSFAGVTGGALVVAGGANFPDKIPWDGGTKVWYDTVFVLEQPNAEWKVAGKLPRPLGYGVSVTYNGSLICVGGSDAQRHYADAFRIEWRDGKLLTTMLAPLPKPAANGCGAMVGDMLYVAGGIEKPNSAYTLRTVWRLDLSSSNPKWTSIEPCPGGGRMLAVAAGLDDAFWLIGGVDLAPGKDGMAERRYLTDAYCYAQKTWTRIADLPYPAAAAPSPAPTDTTSFYLLGGDDGSQIGIDPNKHRGFGTTVLRYDLKSGEWTKAGEVAARLVTTPCIHWNSLWIIPGGEVRPGRRSPEVWSWTTGKSE